MPAATMWACKSHKSCTCTKVWRLSYIRMTRAGGTASGSFGAGWEFAWERAPLHSEQKGASAYGVGGGVVGCISVRWGSRGRGWGGRLAATRASWAWAGWIGG